MKMIWYEKSHSHIFSAHLLISPHRCELKMPVLDAITLVDFFHSAVTDDPVFGLTLP